MDVEKTKNEDFPTLGEKLDWATESKIEESTSSKEKKKLTTEEVTYYILKEIEEIESKKSTKRKMVEEQERTWLKFSSVIPRKVKKEIPPLIKEKTGYRVKWLKDGCLVVEFFSEDELEEIRHRQNQKKAIEKDTEELKGQPKRKRRETIPKPQSIEGNDPPKYKSKPYNKKNFSSSQSKHPKSLTQK